MTSALQQEILLTLAQLRELSPDVLLGQMLAHLGFLAEGRFDRSLSNIEDQQLLEVMQQHRVEPTRRSEHAA